jgi:predicted Rossmann-fold nucleotide-binding protein
MSDSTNNDVVSKVLPKLTVPKSIANGYFQAILQRGYQGQVEGYELEMLRQTMGVVDNATLVAAEQDVLKFAEEFIKVMNDTRGIPVLTSFGTARDQCVTPLTEEFAKLLGDKCMERGIYNVNGASSTGLMGVFSRAFAAGAEKHKRPDHGALHVPLLFTTDEVTETLCKLHAHVSPKHVTFMTRVPALLAMGESLNIVINLGGRGTDLEIDAVSQDMQLRNLIIAAYTGRTSDTLPKLHFFDEMIDTGMGPMWLFDYIILREELQLAAGTIDAKDVSRSNVIRVGEPDPNYWMQNANVVKEGHLPIKYFPTVDAATTFITEDAVERYDKLAALYKTMCAQEDADAARKSA